MSETEFVEFHAARDREAFLEMDSGRVVARRMRGRGLEIVPDDVVDHLVQTYGQLRLTFLRAGKMKQANAPVSVLRQTVREAARCSRCGEVDQRALDGGQVQRVSGRLVCGGCLEEEQTKR